MQEHSFELITPPIDRAISVANERGLTQPLLLFLAGHRPLAFVMGQVLTLGAPIGRIVGWRALSDWADLFSHPDGPTQLEQLLHARSEEIG